jgi:hypothetical protein
MYSYKRELAKVQEMLNCFIKAKFIDAAKLSIMDKIIKMTEEDQIKILNFSSLPLKTQRTVFGAIRNTSTSLKGMKERLSMASLRHENPTVAELALEIMDSLLNVAGCLERFTIDTKMTDVETIDKFSRFLYRKSKSFGFCQDVNTQFREAGIQEAQIESFFNDFGSNISQELDIEEEVQSPIENSD